MRINITISQLKYELGRGKTHTFYHHLINMHNKNNCASSCWISNIFTFIQSVTLLINYVIFLSLVFYVRQIQSVLGMNKGLKSGSMSEVDMEAG